MQGKYTEQQCLESAQRFSVPRQWRKHDPALHRYASRRPDLYARCVAHMQKRQRWTKESCLAEARKYQTRKEWRAASPSSYVIAKRRNWLEEAAAHMRRLPFSRTSWTFARCKEDALRFQTRSEWAFQSRGAYAAAQKNGWFDECVHHMREVHTSWTLDSCKADALRFQTRREWQLSSNGYQAALRNGWVDECCPHMEPYAWSLEACQTDAARFLTRSQWLRSSSGAYSAAVNNRWLEQIYTSIGLKRIGGTSAPEQALRAELIQLASDIIAQYRVPGAHRSLDCYSPSKKVGIEFNGLYWHNEESKGKTYHLDKTNACKAEGIRLIHIWEHEWRDRRSQVLSFLRSALSANPTKIGARKCEFRWVEPAAVKTLLESTHIQGFARQSKYALGVYHQGELVGAATFGKHHRGRPVTVLNRLVFKDGVTISGGFSKISKLAAERFGTIISWVDLAKSDGQGYLKAGWKVEEVLKPDYFYHDSQGNAYSKQSRKKSAVRTPQGMTEREHALQDGLYRVWDCGKMRLSFSPRQRPPVVSSFSHEED